MARWAGASRVCTCTKQTVSTPSLDSRQLYFLPLTPLPCLYYRYKSSKYTSPFGQQATSSPPTLGTTPAQVDLKQSASSPEWFDMELRLEIPSISDLNDSCNSYLVLRRPNGNDVLVPMARHHWNSTVPTSCFKSGTTGLLAHLNPGQRESVQVQNTSRIPIAVIWIQQISSMSSVPMTQCTRSSTMDHG